MQVAEMLLRLAVMSLVGKSFYSFFLQGRRNWKEPKGIEGTPNIPNSLLQFGAKELEGIQKELAIPSASKTLTLTS
jgi:hypothetical protein